MRKRKDGEYGQANSGHCVLTEEKKEVQWQGKVNQDFLLQSWWLAVSHSRKMVRNHVQGKAGFGAFVLD